MLVQNDSVFEDLKKKLISHNDRLTKAKYTRAHAIDTYGFGSAEAIIACNNYVKARDENYLSTAQMLALSAWYHSGKLTKMLVVEGFDSEDEAAEFVSILREAGVDEFVFAADNYNPFLSIYYLTEAGCKTGSFCWTPHFRLEDKATGMPKLVYGITIYL